MLFKYCSSYLASILTGVSAGEITGWLEKPKHAEHGDVALPCYHLSRFMKKPPQKIAQELAASIDSEMFASVEAAGPYVNFHFKPETLSPSIVNTILTKGISFGENEIGKSQRMVVDLSHPNIAKPFSMGHLRSTVIGNALCLLGEKNGYEMVRINYIGDWGTQFGKLIVAYNKWGEAKKVEENPIPELLKLYVKFHKEAEMDPSLDDEARIAFRELEDGEESRVSLWSKFRSESIMAFQKVYNLLGIEFDSWKGEAAYNDSMAQTVTRLQEASLLEESDGAMIVSLADKGLPPCLIKKKDGASLYATRDLTAVYDRYDEYSFTHALYVVGQEQTVHFQQVFEVLKKLQAPFSGQLEHIPFGLYLKYGQKMSTRKGHVILLEEVLKESIQKARENIVQRNRNHEHLDEVSLQVGIGAVIFHDLKQDRMNNIEFNLEEMLTFEGETGPYLQYAFARAHSLLRKAPLETYHYYKVEHETAWKLVKKLNEFPEVIERAFDKRSPAVLAQYLLKLGRLFSQFYSQVQIVTNSKEKESRLALVKAFTLVMEEGLRLLGMKAPKKM